MRSCTAMTKAGDLSMGTSYHKASEAHEIAQGSKSAAEYRRTLQQQVNDPVVLLFGRASTSSDQALQQGQASFLQRSEGLPGNVHLLTLKDNGDGQILLRLAHLYQVSLPAHSLLMCRPIPSAKGLVNAAIQSSARNVHAQV